ncbi:DNA-directed RNA polymerase ii subunit rpb1 [Phlyctema vagabunda]|uniref:DNA-directed RNA polymerase ii subunit rpb1 n=1 Tax=Phlyctema vagabunda TaxID=108571 RepID=A0ABR4PJG1_9HELO
MNAHALLTSQGWRGTGHSLNPTTDSIGLSRPLLVSQKQNNLGVGKKQHRTSDMWWMNAFDKSLQGLDTSKDGAVVQTITNGGLDMVVKGGAKYVGNTGGLYACFVKGECLTGTIQSKEDPQQKKRKRDEESKEGRRARKATKRASRSVATGAEKDSESGSKSEAKKERREKRRLKKLRKEAKLARRAESNEKSEEEETDTLARKIETKEERKERKRQKKLLRQESTTEDESEKEKKKKKRRRD